ncbi:SDR family oxidoreductase [Enterococcus dongliensis]|uniref:elongation factor P 5-aminopentanone reductase n=1 Tax=Enterococcus dongliensis TaxID=2559925 RepID=UPI002892509A|nr:SDR family oxidoreductase [Enterococcus dongliensis]MDT2612858.1 SDR family oxidoreductase [Enterococcus dongliensis]MDT2640790.1 SDR family oxidoreductase [Enterococcus dongliensis]
MPYALVMGASGDIGQAVCEKLAEQGWSLYCHYNQQKEKVLNFVSDLQKRYPQQDFFMVSLDMLKEAEIPSFLAQLFQVDGIVFASGFTFYELLPETKADQMEALWQVHLKTPLLLLQELQGKLAKNSNGRVVFIGSVYGHRGSSMETVYSAVKGAQEAFVKAYAKEVATLGITVNVVAPGAVQTRMNDNWDLQELVDLKSAIPLGRLAKPSEIAAACSYLFSQEANYTTGIILPVAGGWMT